jgi:hypothetical protein
MLISGHIFGKKFFGDSYLISLFANAQIINSSIEVKKLIRYLVNKNILHYNLSGIRLQRLKS